MMQIINKKTHFLDNIDEAAKHMKEFKCLIMYPPGKGITFSLKEIKKALKKNKKECMVIDDFKGSLDEAIKILEFERFVAIGINTDYCHVDKGIKNKIIKKGFYVKYYDREYDLYITTTKGIYWSDTPSKNNHNRNTLVPKRF